MNELSSQIKIGEDTPLEPVQNNKIFVNTAFIKSKTIDRTAGLGKTSAMDVEINTKIPVHIHSNKFKCGLIVVVTVSTLSAIISISLAYYHCVTVSLLQDQVNFLMMKMENVTNRQNVNPPSLASSRAEAQIASPQSIFYNRDSLSINLSPPVHPSASPSLAYNKTMLENGLFVTHFNGAYTELNMGLDSIIGPWVRDNKVSSANSYDKIELENKHVIIKEQGLYMIYAQVVYLTHEPCCYYIWAHQPTASPRLLATCATSSDSSERPLSRSQISCATQTVTRLYEGDVINLAQREHNRTVWLRPGYSYFGFVKIAS